LSALRCGALKVHHFRCHASALPELAAHVALTGTSAIDDSEFRELGLSSDLDGYIPAADLGAVQAKFGLTEDRAGNVSLCVR
jgi:hypothetical protein